MAWLEVHQALWRHRKTLVLAHSLGIRPTYAAAHLAHLWCWAIDNALLDFDRHQGHLTGLPNAVIAVGADWEGEPDVFVAALLGAGWLDQEGDRLVMHDWWDYAGKLIEERQRNAQKQRDWRNRHKPATPPKPAPAVTVTSPLRDDTTVQYSTQPNLVAVHTANAPAREPAPTKPEKAPAAFEAFWIAYPAKAGRAKALDAWRALRPTAETADAILAGVATWKQGRRWADGFVMEPARWLKERRWEDEPETAAAPARASPASRRPKLDMDAAAAAIDAARNGHSNGVKGHDDDSIEARFRHSQDLLAQPIRRPG